MPFQIVYMPDARDHLRSFAAAARATVIDAIDEMLTHEPTVETRNRKALFPNPVACWELRVGDYRVFYDVTVRESAVLIVAVGVKAHGTLTIGREEVEL